MQKTSSSHASQYNFYALLSMIYITFILIANVLIYKIVQIGSFSFTVGSFVTPFWFVITDIVAEVYGYQLVRKLIWSGILCGLLFTVVCAILINLPSPSSWAHQHSYDQVLGKLPRILVGYVAGVITGAFINTYLITKWKILTHGKYFWLRSVSSSMIGQLVFTIVTISFDLLGILTSSDIIKLILISMTIKLVVTPLLAVPSAILVYYLKKYERMDIYDYHTDFNPFRFKLGSI